MAACIWIPTAHVEQRSAGLAAGCARCAPPAQGADATDGDDRTHPPGGDAAADDDMVPEPVLAMAKPARLAATREVAEASYGGYGYGSYGDSGLGGYGTYGGANDTAGAADDTATNSTDTNATIPDTAPYSFNFEFLVRCLPSKTHLRTGQELAPLHASVAAAPDVCNASCGAALLNAADTHHAVQGMDFNTLMADPVKVGAFKLNVRQAVAASTGLDIANIIVNKLSSGSVVSGMGGNAAVQAPCNMHICAGAAHYSFPNGLGSVHGD